jgi:hypothetical protein
LFAHIIFTFCCEEERGRTAKESQLTAISITFTASTPLPIPEALQRYRIHFALIAVFFPLRSAPLSNSLLCAQNRRWNWDEWKETRSMALRGKGDCQTLDCHSNASLLILMIDQM